MKRVNYIWKGFEFKPQGCLLEQFVDLSTAMGVAYERSCDFYKDFHTHDRLMLVFPRASCIMEVRTRAPQTRLQVDQASVLLVPARLDHDDEGISSIYDTLALYPSEELVRKTVLANGYSKKMEADLRMKCHKLALPQIADSASASVATLLRHFRKETKTTPGKVVEMIESYCGRLQNRG
jgi:hypothetical protein